MKTTVAIHFQNADPILHTWILKIESLPPLPILQPNQYFTRLCDDIISQQLSGRAAATIFSRFIKLFKNEHINPQELVNIPHEKIREAGLSNAKANYVKNLAQHVIDGSLKLDRLTNLPDEEVITELTKVKGIGRWTAEMFLLFSLGRPDVFSHGDLGLRNGLKKIYGFKREPSKKKIEALIKKWSPYKSYASRILWKCLEIKEEI